MWIVAEPRPEHVAAVSWLNDSSSARFYLLKVEGVRIGASDPAPLLTLIVGPGEESAHVGDTKKDIAERYTIRYRFWKELLERAKSKTKLFSAIPPGQVSWLGTGAGRSGLAYNFAVRQHDAQVELYIDRGEDSEEENKRIFDVLFSKCEEIEKAFGGKLNWERLDNRRASRISVRMDIGGYRDEDKYSQIQDAMIDAMCRFENALRSDVASMKS